jgi:protein-tyrosine phosphatase
VNRGDFGEFDYLLAMDETNLRALERLCPSQHAHKLRLFMEFSTGNALREVPDPYYGEEQGFERVLDMAEQAAPGLLDHLRSRLQNR